MWFAAAESLVEYFFFFLLTTRVLLSIYVGSGSRTAWACTNKSLETTDLHDIIRLKRIASSSLHLRGIYVNSQ